MTHDALYDEELDTSIGDDDETSIEQDEHHLSAPLNEEAEWPAEESPYPVHEQPQADTGFEAPDPIDQLSIDLTLRCGSLNLTLGDLRRIAAGTVLEVSGVTPGFATLCHGERVVAEGELVDVDGRLGLQILRMASPA